MKKITITYDEVKNEVINRQKCFGTEKDPDICKNKHFNGITFKYMIILINNWPKCWEDNEYLAIEIEYNDMEEIPFALYCTACKMIGKD